MRVELNLEKAIQIVERHAKYIEQLRASGYKLPESYNTIPQELEDIKRDPSRRGISNERLEKIKYLYNKNQITSRAKLDTSMTINGLGNIEPIDIGRVKPRQASKLQEYSDKMNDMVNEYLDKIDTKNYPNSLPTLQAKRVMQEAQMLGLDIRDIDYTKLTDIGPESLRVSTILKDIQMMFSNAPAHISPFKEQIYKQIGEQEHVKFLTDMGFSNVDISLFEQYIDSSQFWNMIHKAHYSSSQETGRHEIRDAVKRLKAAMFDIQSNKKDFEELQRLLKNANNYRAIDAFVKKRLSKLYKQGKL